MHDILKQRPRKLFNVSFLSLFLVAIFMQAYSVSVFSISIKPYMLYCLITLPILMIFKANFSFKKLYNHEIFWLLSYLVIFFSCFLVSDYKLAVQLILGQVILVIAFILFRCLIDGISLEKFEKILIKTGKFFILTSLALFLVGIYSYFFSQIIAPTQLNEKSFRIFGLYIEGFLPRLTGLAESPNNYAYLSNVLFWLFVFKKEKKYVLLTLVSMLLTFSSTLILVLILQSVLFLMLKFNFRIFITFGFITLLIFSVLFYLYATNENITKLLEYRILRTSTGSGRFELWEYCWSLIKESPLFGYGANQTRILLKPFRNLMSSHNSLIEMFLTTGIFGFTTYLTFLFLLLRNSYLLIRKQSTPVFFIITFGFVVFGMANNILHIEYVVFLIGILYAYNRAEKISLNYTNTK